MSPITWEVLDLGCDDETRQAIGDLASITSLYEVAKLAYLQPSAGPGDTQVVVLPEAVCSAAWGLVCVALDSTLLLFAENCSTLQFQLKMEHSIDTVLWLGCPEFIIVGDRSGSVHCIHIPSQQVLMSLNLPVSAATSDALLFVESSCHPVVDGITSVVLLTAAGTMIRLQNLNVERMQEAMSRGILEELQDVKAQMGVDVVPLLPSDVQQQVACSGSWLGARDSDVWVWLGSRCGALLQHTDTDATAQVLAQAEEGQHYTKIMPVGNARYLVTLSNTGVLGLCCTVTGLSMRCPSDGGRVLDAVVLPWTQAADVQLLVLSLDRHGAWFLRILTVPGMLCEYEVEVSPHSQVVPLGEGVEAMVFLEPEQPPQYPQSAIKIKTIVDGVPEARLKKLISKLKFQEAEDMAHHFGLDIELVFKGRANHIVHLLNPYTATTSLHATNTSACNMEAAATSLLAELLEVLDSVSDMEFVTALCVDATLPSLSTIATVLNYAKNRLAAIMQRQESEWVSSLTERVSQLLYRLTTFGSLHVVDEASIDQWLAFSAADLLQLFMNHLRKGELSVASSIWQRHQHEFQHSIDDRRVYCILQLLPSTLPSSALIAWLPHNLSDLIRICPQAIDTIAHWALTMIKRLEMLKSCWPGNALAMAVTVVGVLEAVVAEFSAGGNIEVQMGLHLAHWKAHMSPTSSLYQLRKVLQALRDLRTLADRYRLRPSLDQYMQEDKTTVVWCLLDWLVCGEEVAPLVDHFIIPVLLKQSEASADTLLADYLHDTLPNDGLGCWAWQEAQWEDKLYAIIAVIRDEQVRVSCTVSCMRVASVPWSAGTHAMCRAALQVLEAGGGGGPGEKEELLELQRLVTLKMVLRKHAIHLSNVSDTRSAELVLRRMARSEQAGVVEDMLSVVATYSHLTPSQAYVYRALHLMSRGDYSSVQDMLLAVPAEHLPDTCHRLLQYSLQTLHFAPCGQQMRAARCNLISGVVSLEQLITGSCTSRGGAQLEDDLAIIRTVNELQRKFSVYPCLATLHDPSRCRALLNKRLTEWYQQHSHTLLQSAVPTAATDQQLSSTSNPVLVELSPTDVARNNLRNTRSRETLDGKENINVTSTMHDKDSQRKFSSSAARRCSTKPGSNVPVNANVTTLGTSATVGSSAHGDCIVEEEEESSGGSGSSLSRMLELSRLLGCGVVAALQQLATLALESGHLAIAMAMARRISEEPVGGSSSGGGSMDTTLVQGILQLLVQQLQQQVTSSSSDADSLSDSAFPDPDDGSPKAASVAGDGGGYTAVARLLHLTQDMVAAALLQAQPVSMQWLALVAEWCGTGGALYRQCHQEGVYADDGNREGDPYTTWRFSPLYSDRGMPVHHEKVSLAVLEALRACLLCCDTTCEVLSPSQPLVAALTDLSLHCSHRNNDLSALLLDTKLYAMLSVPGRELDAANQQKPALLGASKIFTLLLKVVNPNRTDVKLAVSLLTLLTLKEGLAVLNELIKRFGYDYPRLEALSEIGVNLCGVHKKIDIRIRFEDLAKNSKWGRRFAEMNISFKESFGKHAAALHKLFDVIVLNPKCSLALLKDFCADFNLSLTDASLCFLQSLLRSFTPEPVKVSEEVDKWHVPQMPHELSERLVNVISKIDDRIMLVKKLRVELSNTNCYNYDMLNFILENLCRLDTDDDCEESWQRGFDILQFLKGYDRKCKPNEAEINPDCETLPILSSQRLPFHDLFQGGTKLIMKIINDELDVNTIDIWLRSSESLKLKQDQMCFVAVQNTASRTLQKLVKRDHVKWQLAHNHRRLLQDISRVILQIKHDRLAMACAKNVVQLLPPGIDKVDSAYNCLLMAKRWQQNCDSSESRGAVEKFGSQHQELAVEHTLHRHGVADSVYIRLLQDPVQLITALYDHESLASLTALSTEKMPSINECVTEICEEVGCDQALIQRNLLEKWLPPSYSSSGQEMDVTISNFQLNLLSPTLDSGDTTDQASLSRVIYLLQGCHPDVMSYLLDIAESSGGSSSVCTQHRLRALKCLLAVADRDMLAKYVTVDKIQALLKSLSYVSRLEALGCPTDTDQLASVDKAALAEGVWRSHRHNPHALLLIADICLDYQVSKPSLWNAVLGQLATLMKAGAVEEAQLQALLLTLRRHPKLWLLPGFAAAWTSLVTRPFNIARPPLSPAALTRCIQCTGLLAQCPVPLPAVDGLLACCTALDQPALAMVISAASVTLQANMQAMMDEVPRDELMKQFKVIKSKIPLPRLIEKLLETHDMTLE